MSRRVIVIPETPAYSRKNIFAETGDQSMKKQFINLKLLSVPLAFLVA
jgi:hypothetical protein